MATIVFFFTCCAYPLSCHFSHSPVPLPFAGSSLPTKECMWSNRSFLKNIFSHCQAHFRHLAGALKWHADTRVSDFTMQLSLFWMPTINKLCRGIGIVGDFLFTMQMSPLVWRDKDNSLLHALLCFLILLLWWMRIIHCFECSQGQQYVKESNMIELEWMIHWKVPVYCFFLPCYASRHKYTGKLVSGIGASPIAISVTFKTIIALFTILETSRSIHSVLLS